MAQPQTFRNPPQQIVVRKQRRSRGKLKRVSSIGGSSPPSSSTRQQQNQAKKKGIPKRTKEESKTKDLPYTVVIGDNDSSRCLSKKASDLVPPQAINDFSSSTAAATSILATTKGAGRCPCNLGRSVGDETFATRSPSSSPLLSERKDLFVIARTTNCSAGSSSTTTSMAAAGNNKNQNNENPPPSPLPRRTTMAGKKYNNSTNVVRFKSKILVRHVIPAIQLMTDQSPEALWYQPEELQAMYAKIAKIVVKVRTKGQKIMLIEDDQIVTRGRQENNSKVNYKTKKKAICIRGLERMIAPNMAKQKRMQAVDTVLDLQQQALLLDPSCCSCGRPRRSVANNTNLEHAMAEQYKNVTHECIKQAIELARTDAEEVAKTCH